MVLRLEVMAGCVVRLVGEEADWIVVVAVMVVMVAMMRLWRCGKRCGLFESGSGHVEGGSVWDTMAV